MIRLFSLFGAALLAMSLSLPAAADKHGAMREDAVTVTAQIRGVDYNTREVLLRSEDGEDVVVVAGPEVRNFNQIAIGDVLSITYYEEVAAHIANAESSSTPSGAATAGRAAEGEKPGMIAASVVNTVVEFISYDADSHVATFINADGTPGSVAVNPKMQEFAASLKKGDMVDVTITRAIAISMESPSN